MDRLSGTGPADQSSMCRLLTLTALLIAISANARIGETAIQLVDRYGAPKDMASSKIYDKNSPVLEGAVHHTYEYQG